jgi:hypothetical protein
MTIKNLFIILLVIFLTSCEDSSLKIDDKSLKSFEDLERRELVTINRGLFYNSFTNIEWSKLTREEAKLLFSTKSVRDLFVEENKLKGIDISSSAQRASFIGKPYEKILMGYDDALKELNKSSNK